MVTDSEGNIYITGFFTYETDFEGITFTTEKTTASFVVKIDPLGNVLWAKKLGDGTGVNSFRGITIDSSENVYTTGTFTGIATFDNITLNTGSSNTVNIYIVKQDPLGNVLWATNFGNTQNFGSIRPFSIVADSQDNVYTIGTFSDYDSLTFGNITLIRSSPEGIDNAFIVKQDSSGNVLWAKILNQTDSIYIEKVITDSSDNVYVVGRFDGTLSFGTDVLSNSDQEDDIFLVKLDPLGETIWAKQFEITSSNPYVFSSVNDIDIDQIGNIHIAGNFNGTLQVGTTTLTTPQDIRNMFVIKTDNLGNPLLVKGFWGNTDVFVSSICIDTSNNIYISGSIEDDFWFDDILLTYCGGSTSCPFVLKMNSLGVVEWVEGYGGFTQNIGIRNICTDINGNLLILGGFRFIVFFGDIALSSTEGSSDIFLLKLSEDLSTEKNKFKNWSFYPNPTKDFINLDFSGYNDTEIYAEVFNMLGQKIKVFENVGISKNLDLSELISGIYLLKISHNGASQTIKIKKQ